MAKPETIVPFDLWRSASLLKLLEETSGMEQSLVQLLHHMLLARIAM